MTKPRSPQNDDDDVLAFGVAADFENQVILVNFGQNVTWLAFPPEQARKFAELLVKKAKEIEKGRLQ